MFAEISAPKSGRAVTVADQLGEVTQMTTDDAGLRMVGTLTLDVRTLGTPSLWMVWLAVVGIPASHGRLLQSDPSSDTRNTLVCMQDTAYNYQNDVLLHSLGRGEG